MDKQTDLTNKCKSYSTNAYINKYIGETQMDNVYSWPMQNVAFEGHLHLGLWSPIDYFQKVKKNLPCLKNPSKTFAVFGLQYLEIYR